MGAPVDPTVCTPEQRACIEAAAGIQLSKTEPEVLRFIVDRSRQAGNDAFKRKDYKEAVKMYSQAIAGDEQDHTLFGNRSAAYLAQGLYEQALWDARKSVALSPGWPKGYYRLGSALLALNQWGDAAAALQKGVELDPGNADVAAKLADAQARVEQEVSARRAQAATERRDIVLKLRAARREDHKLVMLNQFKQSMAGPDWDLEDLEWRPTFLPSMKLKPLKPKAVLSSPRSRLLLNYLNALADLAHPKQALAILSDQPRLQAYRRGVRAAVEAQGQGAHALVLGAGTGILGMLAAQAGAGRVTCVERSRMLYRMAKQCLDTNAGTTGMDAVHLVGRRLQSVGVAGEEPPPDMLEQQRLRQQLNQQQQQQQQQRQGAAVHAADGQAATGEGAEGAAGADELEDAELLPGRASLLVTDLLDHSVLGMGLLPCLDYAAERLLVPGAKVVPQAVQVYAVLIELRIREVSGFDLSALNAYCWYPHHERMELSRVQHRPLSAPFAVHTLDLQARVDKAASRREQQQAAGSAAGQAEGQEESNGDEGSEDDQAGPWESDFMLDVPVTAAGHWNAVAFWFEASMGDGTTISSYAPAGGAGQPAASSWGQAVQYVDGAGVAAGSSVQLSVRQDRGQYVFTTHPPQCRPRHALVPRWHFDMVLDTQRNDAYDAAIRRAIQRKRDAGVQEVMALDVGAGSGLLSMMAARAGADSVYAAEISQHMCDVGEEATIMNGYLGKITMLDRDARRLDVLRKPDGTPPDMPRRADVLVQEVFDSGCIGEGVLHLLAAAHARLLAPDALLVPLSASVYCQPIQMRTGEVCGLDMAQANRWRWRPDYEGLELGKCRDAWVPLADPVHVFTFDFAEWQHNTQPAEAILDLCFTQAGICNAVAMWFEVHLDEETSLSTSPYTDKGPTWQQAVQWVEELRVEPGTRLQLTAKHDTYSISYSMSEPSNDEAALAAMRTDVPLKDPMWQAAFDSMQGLNSELVKACVQNPLEYRAVAEAAIRFASRPHDLGVDVQQAVDFCVRMFG